MRTRALVTALLSGALVSGSLGACSAAPDEPPAPSTTKVATSEPRPPAPVNTGAELVGSWTLTDLADGGMTGTVRFSDRGYWDADYECGDFGGPFAAGGDVFYAMWTGGSMGCTDNIDPQPSLTWTTATVSVTPTENGWAFLDAKGATTATLTGHSPQETPTPADPRFLLPSYLDPITPLPATFDVRSMIGLWVPLVAAPGDSYLKLEETDWTSSDGCNGNGGRWADLGGGYIITTPLGPSHLVGCENVPVAEWFHFARTAGFDGDVLVLFDASGDELARFARG